MDSMDRIRQAMVLESDVEMWEMDGSGFYVFVMFLESRDKKSLFYIGVTESIFASLGKLKRKYSIPGIYVKFVIIKCVDRNHARRLEKELVDYFSPAGNMQDSKEKRNRAEYMRNRRAEQKVVGHTKEDELLADISRIKREKERIDYDEILNRGGKQTDKE